MNVAKRLIYMFLGGLVTLGLAFGAYSAFAQTDEGTEDTTEQTAPETGTPENEDEGSVASAPFAHGGPRDHDFGADGEALAEALGITVDELQAAREAAFEAALDQAVSEGLLNEDEAAVLRERPGVALRIPGVRNLGDTIDLNALLADALGISVDELEAARDEVLAIRLAEKVEEGVLTQEQADSILAAEAVRDYVDRDVLQDLIQGFYEDAINQAQADGAITAAQAEQLLSNLENLGPRGFDGPGFGGPRGHRGPGHGGPGPEGGVGFFSGGNGA